MKARTSSSSIPDECIDCGVCEPECPVDAIKPDTEDDPDGKWLKVNTDYAKVWPNITLKGEAAGRRRRLRARDRTSSRNTSATSPGPGS